MQFLQTQFKTDQHCKVSCSSTADAAKAMLVAGMSSDILYRHSIVQPGPNLSTETIKLQKQSKLQFLVSLTAYRSSLNEPHFKTSGFPLLYKVSKLIHNKCSKNDLSIELKKNPMKLSNHMSHEKL